MRGKIRAHRLARAESKRRANTDWPGLAVASRGFTLVEMLVTLVIASMISSLLWQALQQIASVERMLQNSGVQSQLMMVRREWLRSLIESALPNQQNALTWFKGDASELVLDSAETLGLGGLGGGRLQLSLRHDAAQRSNRLTLSQAPSEGFDARVNAAVAVSVTLLNWTGEPARLSYQDQSGLWHEQWPLSGVLVKRLPIAVRVDLAEEVGGPLLVAVAVSVLPLARRVDFEQQ